MLGSSGFFSFMYKKYFNIFTAMAFMIQCMNKFLIFVHVLLLYPTQSIFI